MKRWRLSPYPLNLGLPVICFDYYDAAASASRGLAFALVLFESASLCVNTLGLACWSMRHMEKNSTISDETHRTDCHQHQEPDILIRPSWTFQAQ